MTEQNHYGSFNPNYGKRHTNMHSEEFKARMSERLKKSMEDGTWKPPSTKGKKLNISDEDREARRQRAIKVNTKGFENKGGRCKFYNIDGITLQGRYELYYYLYNNKLPTKPKLQIKTPYGWYRPDFEYQDCYIEIKSTYTIKTATKSGQLRKIAWISKNIQRVKIIVLDIRDVEKYLSSK